MPSSSSGQSSPSGGETLTAPAAAPCPPHKVVAIDIAAAKRASASRDPLPPSNSGKSSPHKNIRSAIVAMFRRRRSVRRIARFLDLPEREVENAIIERLEPEERRVA